MEMKTLILLALLSVVGACATDTLATATDEAALCTVEVCTTDYGCRTFLVECGPTGPYSGPEGLDIGGDPLGTGEACSGQNSCRNGCFCKDGYWRYGTLRAPGFCTYVTASAGGCGIAAAPPPPYVPPGSGGGGSTNPPCHGSGCTVEQSNPTQQQ